MNLGGSGIPVFKMKLAETGKIRDNMKVKLQRHVLDLHAQRRRVARQLVQYNPAFGIREKQIQAFYEGYIKNGGSPAEAAQARQAMIQDMNVKRQQLRKWF